MNPLLSIHDLTVIYPRPGAESAIAARSVSLDLNRGEVLALVGTTGSGKSTLLSAVAGLLPPRAVLASGHAILDPGQDSEIDLVNARPMRRRKLRRRRMAHFRSDLSDQWNPQRTLRQHIREAIDLSGRGREWRSEKRWLETLYEVGLIEPERMLGRYPREVSALVQMRVRLAMALLAGADLWLMDEATAELDATGEDQVLRLLRELAPKFELGVLFATAKIQTIDRFAERVAIFYEGGVVESGRVSDLLQRPKNRYTRALLDTAPRIDINRERLGVIDRASERDAIDATRGVEA